MITVAEYISKFLSDKGVRHVFGYQGGAVMKIIDAIAGNPAIEYIQNYHEQGSAFCANAYAQICGVGVAISTSGPGATNLLTGIVNAYFDSIPVIFITGQDHLCNIKSNKSCRTNGFQDLNIVNIAKTITKYAKLIDSPESIRYELEKAYHLAVSDRPGAVLIDVPYDIQSMQIDENNLAGFDICSRVNDDIINLNEFVKIVKSAKKPLILAGGGIRMANAVEEFNEFIEKTNIPVITTLTGKDSTDKAYGFSGFYGNSCANLALKNTDLLIALGTRFGVQQIGVFQKKYTEADIIRVEIDESEIGRTFINEKLVIKSDLKKFFNKVNKIKLASDYKKWHYRIQQWNEEYRNNICVKSERIDPVDCIRNLTKYFDENTVVTTDVGANQMWVAQALNIEKNQRFLTSSALGAMGYSLPAALGASYAVNGNVVAFMGDGGFQMNMQELNLIASKRRNIKCVVFNNSTLGLIRQIQSYTTKKYIGTESKDFICPNIEKLADCYGLNYIKIETVKDFEKLKVVFNNVEPYLIEVVVDINATALNSYNDTALKII